ncbi:MAG TPA: hypothetical protein VNT79_11705 [Phycisphaerae bacterium]|nr:hypothetical protein [Phycisphaerae bacterium]
MHCKGYVPYIAVVSALGVLTACDQQTETVSMNAPQVEESPPQPEMAEYFAYHNDQGMMSDRSIADIHFVPHCPELSGAGEARLERYAELLATSGGTLWYDTSLGDRELVEARLAMASEFLAHAMPGKTEIKLELGMAGGRGMTAAEAIPGQGVARQPEKRGSAYKLKNSVGGMGGN